MSAELPNNTKVVIPSESVADPSPLTYVYQAALASLRNSIGMQPMSQLAKKGMKANIVFTNRVKGGEHPASRRKVAIPIVVDELHAAGVDKKDVLLTCSNGLHRKNTEQEIRDILGDKISNEFWHLG